ncbi:hypothetical protein OH77DRAFT_1422108 [Trametes cingulata]|nr:hypothetical protein OH77DRAFT_1422108 [Trametes cingulata]
MRVRQCAPYRPRHASCPSQRRSYTPAALSPADPLSSPTPRARPILYSLLIAATRASTWSLLAPFRLPYRVTLASSPDPTMEVLSRPKGPVKLLDKVDCESTTPTLPMPAAPFPVTPSTARLPVADHKPTIPARPSVASRRQSTTASSLSPTRLSRPLRSSPLAGPSIAALTDDALAGSASAPPTPGGGVKHLSPLAEFSTTAPAETGSVSAAETKKQRRRTLGAVFSKLSFAASPGESASEPSSPTIPETPGRRRAKSTTSHEAPPVPPLPSWAHSSMPGRVRPPFNVHSSSSSSRASSSSLHAGSKSSRPTSPTPSARSAGSATSSIRQERDPRRASFRPPPSTSRRPEENWLTQSAAPRFSRLGLKAEGVVLPVSAREAKRRSTASLASKTRSFDTLPPPPMPARTPSRASTSSMGSPPSPLAVRPSTAPAHQQRFRSRASSRASLASAASGLSIDCDTPSLTMSCGPSASDVSLGTATEVDEMGALTSRVEFQLNDVPVGVLAVPVPSYKGKGKERAVDLAVEVRDTDGGTFAPWMRAGASPTPSGLSSAANSVVDLNAGSRAVHARSATAPDLYVAEGAGKDGAKTKRTHTLGRVWRHVMRSVTSRR